MTQVNEDDHATADQVRRGPGERPKDLSEPARSPAAGRAPGQGAGARPLRHPAGSAGGAGKARGHDSGRARRSRKGAAAVDDQGDRGPGGARPGHAWPARHRRPAGGADGHRPGPVGGPAVQEAQGSVARAAAARANSAGTSDAAGGRADLGEAQPVLTGKAHSDGTARRGGTTFGSLRTRNYRLFAAGQVVSNTGSWMQRVAQDWLVLELTHNSGTALGITTGLQFLPLLLLSLWGGVIADRYSKRRILMVTQTVMGGLALILGILALTGSVQIWHVYLLAFMLGLV